MKPTSVPSRPRTTFWPVLRALERSTDSVPSTTQKECWTPVSLGDQHGQTEADRTAQAVVQPDRVPLDVRAGALLGGRQRARATPVGWTPQQPLEPGAPLGRG